MKKFLELTLLVFLLLPYCLTGQENFTESNRTFKGQFSAATHFNGGNDLPLLVSGRYIPQLNFKKELQNSQLLDFELAANIYGNALFNPFTASDYNGKIKDYRAWIRFSARQFEIRAGLQKINFGSATMLRPLMWFDQLDPRDPLGLTNGVWGILGRYYFLNNTNVWFWSLYGNKNPKGWEISGTSEKTVELGGRIQVPVVIGEAALTFHNRKADLSGINPLFVNYRKIQENRIGFDAKLDYIIGFWVEASWINKNADIGLFKNQELLNIGMDYTFGIGNGLNATLEQLLMSYDEKAFDFENTTSFSLLNFSYPVGLFDHLNTIIYYNWTDNKMYNFVNWQKQFDKISIYLMAYRNPKNYQIPTQNTEYNLFGGKGVQIMLVLNH